MWQRRKNSLVGIWTSGDKEVALKMVFMYTLNAKLKGSWGDICFIVWGPSSKLLSEDVGNEMFQISWDLEKK